MTIEGLIRLLKACPLSMRVVVNGYEDGFDDVSPERLAIVKMQLNRGAKDWRDGTRNRQRGLNTRSLVTIS